MTRPHLSALRVAAVAVLVLPLFVLTACEDTRQNIRDGELLLQNDRYEKAIVEFERAIKNFPDSKKTVEEAEQLIRKTYLQWLNSLNSAQSFELAAATAQEFGERFPEDERVQQQAFNLRMRALVERAKNCLEHELPRDAMSVCETILSEAEGSNFTDAAREIRDALGHLWFEAVVEGTSGLFRMNVDGTQLTKVVDGTDHDISEDGQQVVFIRPLGENLDTGSLHVLNLETGEEEEVFSSDVTCHPHFYPGSERYHITKIASTNLFQFLDFEGDKETIYADTFVEDGRPVVDILGPPTPDGKSIYGYRLPAEGASEYQTVVIDATFEWYKDPQVIASPIHQFVFQPETPSLFVVAQDDVYRRDWQKFTPFTAVIDGEEEGLQFGGIAFAPQTKHRILITREDADAAWDFSIMDADGDISPLGVEADFTLKPGTLEWRKGYLTGE